MSLYPPSEPDYDLDDYPAPDPADTAALDEPSQFPPDMRISLSLGLTEYAPNGLLVLIADRFLTTVSRADKWKERFRTLLARLGRERINALLDAEVAEIMSADRAMIRDDLETAIRDYLHAAVNRDGSQLSGMRKSGGEYPSRLEFQTRKLAEQLVKESFAEFESEHRERMKSDLKEILADLMAARIAKALPTPEIFK